MFNHGRTLLMNVPGGSRTAPDFPGEELIPATYIPRELTRAINTLRQLFYGGRPDRLMLNYRTRQLLTLIHSVPELEKFLTDLDPRITYWPPTDDRMFDDVFGETVNNFQGGPSVLSLVGTAEGPGASGQLQRQWRVEVISGTTVDIRQHQPILAQTTGSFTMSAGLSSLIILPGSGFQFRFDSGAGIGTAWLIDSNVRPTDDLGEIAANAEIAGEATFIDVFGLGPAEPFKTFKNLWEQHDQLAWKLGGLLLGVIYRTDLLPQATT